jgi:hypothetical protein
MIEISNCAIVPHLEHRVIAQQRPSSIRPLIPYQFGNKSIVSFLMYMIPDYNHIIAVGAHRLDFQDIAVKPLEIVDLGDAVSARI